MKYIQYLFSTRIKKAIGLIVILGAILFYYSLPERLFQQNFSTVLYDRDGNLMGARVSEDGQWRFPAVDSVSEKFNIALTYFEDEYFHYHPGVNPISLLRATKQNLSAGRVISGASTISMQLIRLSRNESRTFLEKIKEIILAVRLELRYSKSEILKLYSNHAPFGGNVVGVHAAAWRYFGRPPSNLSWAEAATLAVLPNSPGLIHPGRNRAELKDKRDKLLSKLLENNEIDSITYELALSEEIPEKPLNLPNLASHLLSSISAEFPKRGPVYKSNLDSDLQGMLSRVLDEHLVSLKENEIHNAAAVLVDVNNGELLGYVGNAAKESEHSNYVDIVKARRSTGSLLKPFLYAHLIDEGYLLPEQLIDDIPIWIDGFAPKNFSEEYEGVVPAHKALSRSLNIPWVLQLKNYRYDRFYQRLEDWGMNSLDFSSDHYGLSIIIGGSEATLLNLSQMYLNLYHSAYGTEAYSRIKLLRDIQSTEPEPTVQLPVKALSAQFTLEALQGLERPASEGSWEMFEGKQGIAWKTGTSQGHRDAWAIGMNGRYLVGIWVGNADGEGRAGLTGVRAAAPILFSVFNSLPDQIPIPEVNTVGNKLVDICELSGMLAGEACEKVAKQVIIPGADKAGICKYHRWVFVDPASEFQFRMECAGDRTLKKLAYFVLPPIQFAYYSRKHSSVPELPEIHPSCENVGTGHDFEFIYPKPGSVVFVPRNLDGKWSEMVAEVAIDGSSERLFWHLDEQFIEESRGTHRVSMRPEPGNHTLSVVDEQGLMRQVQFSVEITQSAEN